MNTNLEALATTLGPMSPRAVAEFERRLDALLLDVGRDLATYPAISSLIGHAGMARLFEFNREHAKLVRAALRLSDFELLVRGHAWFVRAYQAQGFWRSLFPEAMLAWLRAVQSHMDTPTAAEVSRVYRFLMENDREFNGERETAGAESAPPTTGVFTEALLAGDEALCLEVAEAVLARREGLPVLYDEVLAKAMAAVGALWESGKADSTTERIAVGIVERVMGMAATRFDLHRVADGPRAVVACAPEEQHALGARMVADLLRLDGWNVTYLGASPVAGDLVKLLRRQRPALLALSVAMPGHLVEVKNLVGAIRGDPALDGVRVVLGGAVLQLVSERTVRGLGVDGGARDARGAVRAAAAVTGGDRRPLGERLSSRHVS